MKVYINNTECLCNSKMLIKESLKNTSSVILNNVYPKSWETDRDYTNFYMPKDYTRVIIQDDAPNQTEYDLIENVYTLKDRATSNGKINYFAGYYIDCIKVIPGRTYDITINKTEAGNRMLFGADSTDIDTPIIEVLTINGGTHTYTVTPTTKYLIYYREIPDYEVMKATSVKLTVNDIIFSGYLKNSGNINLNPRFPHYSTLEVLDYKGLLSEGDLLNYVQESDNIKNIIKNTIKDKEGFFIGKLDLEDTEMNIYNCNNKTIYDLFEYLSEISGAIWYTKTIDPDITLINFVAIDNLNQSEDIEYTQNYFETKKIKDIKYSYSAKNYRNKQEIVSDNMKSAITQKEKITYIGTDLKTTYPIYSIVSITSDNKNYSFASNIEKSNGVYAKFYYTPGENSIEVDQSIRTGLVFKVEYYVEGTGRQVIYNSDEIDRISESTNREGIISRYEKRTDTNNEFDLNQIAQTYLDLKGVPEITVTIESWNNDLYEIGDRVFFNAPLDDLKTNYLVIEKQIERIVSGSQEEIFYAYHLSSNFSDDMAINYFDNQRRKQQGNIQEGDFIQRNIDFPSQTNIIFYDLSITEETVPSNALDSELEFEI